MLLSIASYNVLADGYVRPEFYPDIDPQLLRKERRYPQVAERLRRLLPDIICLQEVEQGLIPYLKSVFKPPLWTYARASRGPGRPDGCLTVFRNPWTVVEAHPVLYADRIDTPKQAGGCALITVCQRTYDGTNDYDDEIGPAHEPRVRELVVVNTHLKWDDPRAAEPDRIGLRQGRYLAELLQRWQHRPLVVAGDFNAPPDSPVVQVFREAGFQDAHPADTYTGNFSQPEKLDYLLHNSRLRPLTRRSWRPPLLRADSRLPSWVEPSDHLPLMATFSA